MALFTLLELFDLMVMIAGVGYIFSGIIKLPQETHIHNAYQDFLYAAAIAAPAVVLHELFHKFMALVFGLSATLHASYFGISFGILLKLMNLGLFFIPGYVSISGGGALASTLSALAGPLANLLLALACTAILTYSHKLSHKTSVGLILAKKLNWFLFCFNMIPLPPFDGYTVVTGIMELFLGI